MELFIRFGLSRFIYLMPESLVSKFLPYDWRRIQKSFESLRNRAHEYSSTFYHHFWTDYPETRELFGRNMSKTELDIRINHFMLFMTENAGRPKAFMNYLRYLANRHKAYGIYAHQFDYVCETNIKTLNQLLGAKMEAEDEQAWRQGFRFIASYMKACEKFKVRK